MNLDPRTVVFLTALSGLLMGLAMLLTARSYPGQAHGLRSWAWACAAQSVAWILFALRGHVPDLLSVVVSNCAFVLAAALYLEAVTLSQGQPFRRRGALAVVATTFVAFLPFTYLVPNVAARLVIVTTALAGLMFVAGHVLLVRSGEKPLSQWITGLGFWLASGLTVGRASYLLVVDPALAAGMNDDPVQEATFVGNYVAVVMMSFGFVLMRSDRANAENLRLARTDGMTGCLNRMALERHLQEEVARAARDGTPLSIAIVDLDRFKSINDSLGHPEGDAALRSVAEVLRRELRPADVLGRYGGDEFCVLMPGTTLVEAASKAERIRAAVEVAQFSASRRSVTISIGVAAREDSDVETLLRNADEALYRAKAEGRNKVVAFRQITQPSRATA